MLRPGLEECAWSTADYSVEVSTRKVPICVACVCMQVCLCTVFSRACLYDSDKNVCTLVHVVEEKKESYACMCISGKVYFCSMALTMCARVFLCLS